MVCMMSDEGEGEDSPESLTVVRQQEAVRLNQSAVHREEAAKDCCRTSSSGENASDSDIGEPMPELVEEDPLYVFHFPRAMSRDVRQADKLVATISIANSKSCYRVQLKFKELCLQILGCKCQATDTLSSSQQ
eukprot:s42_g16.t1